VFVKPPETVIVTSGELSEDPSRHARQALGRLGETAEGFWLHVVLDVLSGDDFPAVDYPDPRGLTFEQLRDVLSAAFASPDILGASVVILNPNRDPTGGQAAIQVVELLADAAGR
jgi:arginase